MLQKTTTLIETTKALLLLILCLSSCADAVMPWSTPPKWVSYCQNGNTSGMRQVDCDELGIDGMSKCLQVPDHDHTLSVAIGKCPKLLPLEGTTNFDDTAYRLYVNNLPLSFKAYISQERCSKLGAEVQQKLMEAFVNNNSVGFVESILKKCPLLSNDLWTGFVQQAQMQGRSDLLQLAPARYRNRVGMQSPDEVQVPPKNVTDPTANPLAYNPFTWNDPSKMNTPIEIDPLSLMKISPQTIMANMRLLTRLNSKQASAFGMISNGCMGLTEAHFSQPGLSVSVVSSLPLNCFKKIPPRAFSGLSSEMIAAIPWWSFVSRDQIRHINTGDAIRALPFDQLGPGRQKGNDDHMHPCWCITRDQLRSIRKDKTANKNYNYRCVKSLAPPSLMKLNISLIFIIILVSAIMICN